jgi:hypothetical protein
LVIYATSNFNELKHYLFAGFDAFFSIRLGLSVVGLSSWLVRQAFVFVALSGRTSITIRLGYVRWESLSSRP